MDKFSQRAFEVRHRDAAIDTKALDLEEHRVMRGVRCVPTKDAPRRNHPNRRATPLHRVNLNRRGLRTQRKALSGVESVLRLARGMAFRNIQGVEVIEISFDLTIVFHDITKRNEDVFDPLPHQSDRMKMTRARSAAG